MKLIQQVYLILLLACLICNNSQIFTTVIMSRLYWDHQNSRKLEIFCHDFWSILSLKFEFWLVKLIWVLIWHMGSNSNINEQLGRLFWSFKYPWVILDLNHGNLIQIGITMMERGCCFKFIRMRQVFCKQAWLVLSVETG